MNKRVFQFLLAASVDQCLQRTTLRLLIFYAAHENEKTLLAFPSNAYISAKTGIWRADIQKARQTLISLGWLKYAKSTASGVGAYRICIPDPAEVTSRQIDSEARESQASDPQADAGNSQAGDIPPPAAHSHAHQAGDTHSPWPEDSGPPPPQSSGPEQNLLTKEKTDEPHPPSNQTREGAFDPRNITLIGDLTDKTWQDYCNHRQERRAPLTKSSIDYALSDLRTIAESGSSVEEAVKKALKGGLAFFPMPKRGASVGSSATTGNKNFLEGLELIK